MDLLSIDRRAHQQLLRQRHQITTKSSSREVLLKCYRSSLISSSDDDYYDKRCCEKVKKTRKKEKHHPSNTKIISRRMNKMSMMYWKNILVFSVIMLINIATKECIAARQLEGMSCSTVFIVFNNFPHSFSNSFILLWMMMMMILILAARHFNLI